MRHQHACRVVAAALFASLCGACSGPTSPSDLQERIKVVWSLLSQQAAGQTPVAPPAGSTFRFEIADERAAITADSNRCSGAALVGAGTVTLGPALACTRAFCPSAPFDDAFVRMLAGESAARIDGNTLTLQSDRGVLRFQR